MFLGAAAGWCFIHTELWWNVCGVVLMLLANFCDSTDGQMARLTNHKTLIGRMLDGFASDVWYFFCYLAIVIRLWNQPIPFTTVNWGFWSVPLQASTGMPASASWPTTTVRYTSISSKVRKVVNSPVPRLRSVSLMPYPCAAWDR